MAWFPQGAASLDAVRQEQGTPVLSQGRPWLASQRTAHGAEELTVRRTNSGDLSVSLRRIDHRCRSRMIPLETRYQATGEILGCLLTDSLTLHSTVCQAAYAFAFKRDASPAEQ